MTTRHQLRQQLGVPVPARPDRDWVFTTELQAEAAISYRRVDYWTRTGLLTPLHEDISPGTGHLRRYPADQVERARHIAIRLSELAGRMHDDLRDVQTALADADRRLDYAKQDPALQGSTTTSSTTNQAGATA